MLADVSVLVVVRPRAADRTFAIGDGTPRWGLLPKRKPIPLEDSWSGVCVRNSEIISLDGFSVLGTSLGKHVLQLFQFEFRCR